MFAMSYLIRSCTTCSLNWLFSYMCFKVVLMNMQLFIGSCSDKIVIDVSGEGLEIAVHV